MTMDTPRKTILGSSAGRQVEPRQSNEKTKKYRMALKTVLEALIEEETEKSMKTRLRKKEYKSAREEEARQFSLRRIKGTVMV